MRYFFKLITWGRDTFFFKMKRPLIKSVCNVCEIREGFRERRREDVAEGREVRFRHCPENPLVTRINKTSPPIMPFRI